jgi:hypothetical protein
VFVDPTVTVPMPRQCTKCMAHPPGASILGRRPSISIFNSRASIHVVSSTSAPPMAVLLFSSTRCSSPFPPRTTGTASQSKASSVPVRNDDGDGGGADPAPDGGGSGGRGRGSAAAHPRGHGRRHGRHLRHPLPAQAGPLRVRPQGMYICTRVVASSFPSPAGRGRTQNISAGELPSLIVLAPLTWSSGALPFVAPAPASMHVLPPRPAVVTPAGRLHGDGRTWTAIERTTGQGRCAVPVAAARFLSRSAALPDRGG